MTDKIENATFYSFKQSGKWYAVGRGHLSEGVFGIARREKRARIADENGLKYPGLNSSGAEFIFVIILDESVEFGWPLLILPEAMA